MEEFLFGITQSVLSLIGHRDQKKHARLEAIGRLTETFPDIDIEYLKKTVGYYHHEQSSKKIVQRVIEKILEGQLGFYPRRITNSADGSCTEQDSLTDGAASKKKSWFFSRNISSSSLMSSILNLGRSSKNSPDESSDNVTSDLTTKEWNDALRALVERFPDANVSHIRSLIRITPMDPVIILTDHLLSMSEKGIGYPKRLSNDALTAKDYFRTRRYREQCQAELELRYPFIWKSTIESVLAESNNDFCVALESLSSMKVNFFWKAASMLSSSSSSPVVSKKRCSDMGPLLIKPLIVETGKALFEELDPELISDFEKLSRKELLKRTEGDAGIARHLNEQEYYQLGQAIDCSCCFSGFAFEDLGSCSNGHVFCHTCLKRYVQEGLFGQGQLRGMDAVPCFAMEEGNTTSPCKGLFPITELKRCLPVDLMRQYDIAQMERAVKESGLETVRCPFCFYQEEAPVENALRKRLRQGYAHMRHFLQQHVLTLFLCVLFCVSLQTPVPLSTLSLLSFSTAFIYKSIWQKKKYRAPIIDFFQTSRIGRWWHKWFLWREPHILNCKNPECQRVSCTDCSKAWQPLHDCFGEEKDQLRLYVEQAMTDALIRICPSCNIRFSKVDGCNKMKCPNCNYSMCYICRKDISKEGYSHFCQHFRIQIGPCKECSKCDLYYHEKDKVVIQQAADRARQEWFEKHPDAKRILS